MARNPFIMPNPNVMPNTNVMPNPNVTEVFLKFLEINKGSRAVGENRNGALW